MVETIRVLVLNNSYEPINVCNARRALRMMLLGKAETIEAEDEFWIRSEYLKLRLPIVIRLLRYVNTPRQAEVPFSKKNVFRRDHYSCQYCGAAGELTLDHIVPRSRGGRTNWDNIVCCCRRCNARKGNRLPGEVGMFLIRPAHKPRYYPFQWMSPRMAGGSHLQWRKYLEPYSPA